MYLYHSIMLLSFEIFFMIVALGVLRWVYTSLQILCLRTPETVYNRVANRQLAVSNEQ